MLERVGTPLAGIADTGQHEDDPDPGVLAEAHRLLQVGNILVEVARVGEVAVGKRRAEEVIEARRVDAERFDLVGDALRLGQEPRLVEGRAIEVADVERADAEHRGDAGRLRQRAGRQRPGSESQFERHQTASMRPLAAERYIASRTSIARRPTSPGAPFTVDRPRQRSTSTSIGSWQV